MSAGALKNFVHLYSAVNWEAPFFCCTFARPALVDKASFEAAWFWLPGNKWRTDKQTDERVSFLEKLWIVKQKYLDWVAAAWVNLFQDNKK